jgi:hypothetical protein
MSSAQLLFPGEKCNKHAVILRPAPRRLAGAATPLKLPFLAAWKNNRCDKPRCIKNGRTEHRLVNPLLRAPADEDRLPPFEEEASVDNGIPLASVGPGFQLFGVQSAMAQPAERRLNSLPNGAFA